MSGLLNGSAAPKQDVSKPTAIVVRCGDGDKHCRGYQSPDNPMMYLGLLYTIRYEATRAGGNLAFMRHKIAKCHDPACLKEEIMAAYTFKQDPPYVIFIGHSNCAAYHRLVFEGEVDQVTEYSKLKADLVEGKIIAKEFFKDLPIPPKILIYYLDHMDRFIPIDEDTEGVHKERLSTLPNVLELPQPTPRRTQQGDRSHQETVVKA